MFYRVCAAFFLAFIGAAAAGAAPTDFDGDGRSDLTRVEVGGDKNLTWKAVSSQSGETRTLGVLGKEGDHIVAAQWFGAATSIGVVSVDESTGNLVWSVLNGAGVTVQRVFGRKGDLVVSGADFNGNGTADGAVVRYVGRDVQWQVRFDMFAQDAVNEVSFSYGKPGDRVFYARVEPGIDAAGLMRAGSRGASQALMRNVVTGQIRKLVRLPRYASTGNRPRAFPIRLASGLDLLGFQISKGSGTELRVVSMQGGQIMAAQFEGSGVSVVGDFATQAGSEGYEVSFQGGSESGTVVPTQAMVQGTAFLGGIAVDEININTVGSAPDAGSGDSGSGGSGGGSAGPVAQCSETVSWPGSHVYKTIGSTHFTDIRRNTIGVVLKNGARGPFPGCVEAIDSQGRVVAKLGLYARGAGWAARYYAGVGCGAATPFNGARVAAIARANTGKSSIYMNFGGVCYGPIDASRCIGSQQC